METKKSRINRIAGPLLHISRSSKNLMNDLKIKKGETYLETLYEQVLRILVLIGLNLTHLRQLILEKIQVLRHGFHHFISFLFIRGGFQKAICPFRSSVLIFLDLLSRSNYFRNYGRNHLIISDWIHLLRRDQRLRISGTPSIILRRCSQLTLRDGLGQVS